MSARFKLQLEAERYRPGHSVRGTILVLEGGASRSLEVLLEYKEEVKDTLFLASGVASSISTGPLHFGDLEAGMSFRFELAIPEDALPSYRSEHGELYWQVDVKSNERGSDTHECKRIEVESAPR